MFRDNLNRLLIGAVIIFDFLLLFWAVRQYGATAEAIPLAMVVGSVVVTFALLVRLVRFNRNHAVIRHLLTTQGQSGDEDAEANG